MSYNDIAKFHFCVNGVKSSYFNQVMFINDLSVFILTVLVITYLIDSALSTWLNVSFSISNVPSSNPTWPCMPVFAFMVSRCCKLVSCTELCAMIMKLRYSVWMPYLFGLGRKVIPALRLLVGPFSYIFIPCRQTDMYITKFGIRSRNTTSRSRVSHIGHCTVVDAICFTKVVDRYYTYLHKDQFESQDYLLLGSLLKRTSFGVLNFQPGPTSFHSLCVFCLCALWKRSDYSK